MVIVGLSAIGMNDESSSLSRFELMRELRVSVKQKLVQMLDFPYLNPSHRNNLLNFSLHPNEHVVVDKARPSVLVDGSSSGISLLTSRRSRPRVTGH
jgi:hypothetical protein